MPVTEVEGTEVAQVMVGSCTNSSWEDMWMVGQVLRGRRVAPSLSMVIFPGSHRILEVMAREGLLTDLLAAGTTVSESTCGSCAGIGHVAPSGARSLRAFNRNFPGRSGGKDDQVYLCSTAVAAASALTGAISDPRRLGAPPERLYPATLEASDAGLLRPLPEDEAARVEVVRGPNIAEVPRGRPVDEPCARPFSSGSETRSRPTTSRRQERRPCSSGRTSRPSPSSASRTSTHTSWSAPAPRARASSWAASTTARGPRARRRC